MAPKMKRIRNTNGFTGSVTSSAFGPSCGKRKGNIPRVKNKNREEACNHRRILLQVYQKSSICMHVKHRAKVEESIFINGFRIPIAPRE
jgi:hypothetical protein